MRPGEVHNRSSVMAPVHMSKLRISPSTSSKEGMPVNCPVFSAEPVLKLSSTRTLPAPFFMRYSTMLDPMNPAPPVTKNEWPPRSSI